MSLSGSFTAFKLTLLLLVIIPAQIFAVPRLRLPLPTQEYINGRYANPIIKNLILHEYPKLYLGVVFVHFRADFTKNGFGNWTRSHWPILLQDLNLLPPEYVADADRPRPELEELWEEWRPLLRAEPIRNYRNTMVRVLDPMNLAFYKDVPAFQWESLSISYKYLVDEMQHFLEQYDVRNTDRKQILRSSTGRRGRFLAMYWLTVMDQFIGTVEDVRAGGDRWRSPYPRTELIRVRAMPNHVAPNVADQQAIPGSRIGSLVAPVAPPVNAILNPVVPPMLYPHQPADPMTNPLAQAAGPSRSIPVRRAPSAAAGAPSRGTKRKATDQGGGPSHGGKKKGPRGSMRSMDGASNEPQMGQVPQAMKSNSGGSCTALSWISVIMVTISVSLVSFA